MTKKEIEKQVCEILTNMSGETDITKNTRITDDLGLDNLDKLDFLMKLEYEFGIGIPDEDYQDLFVSDDSTTIGDVVKYLHKRLP